MYQKIEYLTKNKKCILQQEKEKKENKRKK